jgi:DUF4097 and DUF4098 domain-containing protein YvlB
MSALALLVSLSCSAPTYADDSISKVNGSIRVKTGEHTGDLDTVNGSITVEDQATVGDVDTVNGSIDVGRNSTTGDLETVNGGIRLEEDVKAASIETVNGKLRLAERTQVQGDVESVNGSITLEKQSDVAGKVENVNGLISLDAAHVGGGLQTVNGDIEIGADSRVEGGILVEKPHGGWFNWTHKTPKVTIGPRAVVEGPIKFEHEVELHVSDSAKIGKIQGVEPQVEK